MRQRTLIREMSVCEMLEWMSYDMSMDDEFKKQLAIEKQKQASADEQYKAFRAIMCKGDK